MDNFDDFDDILSVPFQSFQKGKEEGEKQAQTYSVEEI